MTPNTKTINQNMTKMTMISIKKIASIFLLLDVFLIIFSLYMGGVWLVNTQGGFISSMVIILGSFYGYKKIIEKKTEYFDEKLDEDRDLVDKILDPNELWEEEEEPKKTKFESIKTSFKNTKNYSLGFLSPYRLFGYVVLIGLCFFLVKQNIFNPLAFFVGLSSTIVLILIYTFASIKDIDK